MAELELNEVSRGALGDVLTDAIDLASDQDQTTWLTQNGKRIAAIVPVGDAEYAERAGMPVTVAKGHVIDAVPDVGPTRMMRVAHVEHHIITLADLGREG